MRGWGSSFVLWLVGALLLWAGVALFDHAGVGALILLVPGALMFGMGANSLYRRRGCGDEGDEAVVEPLRKIAARQAQIIPFPRERR
jgi:hypothetical protein